MVYNDGNIVKEIIDDYVYYDEGLKRVHCHPGLLNEPWVHIIIKIWIKLKGYEAMESCEPFEFVKTFSYPDWLVINPIAEPLETLISKFHKLKDDSFYYIARTKPEP